MREGSSYALTGLDAVPWSKIEHAYGPATDIPDLLRTLSASDSKVRDKTWYEFHGNLWHQGTIYEATVPAVPFFIRLLEAEDLPDRHRILLYLALLFTGRSYWDVHKEQTIRREEIVKSEFPEMLQKELSWVEATKKAIREGRQTYAQSLQSRDVRLKIAAAYLLGLIDDGENRALEKVSSQCEK